MSKKLGFLLVGFLMFLTVFSAMGESGFMYPQWIWYPEESDMPSQNAPAEPRYFMKIFDIADTAGVKSADLEVTADDAYKLYVNGENIGEGSSWKIATKYNLMDYLKKGKNVIALEVVNGGGPAGLIIAGKVILKTGKTINLLTNETWKASMETTNNWLTGKMDDTWLNSVELGEFGCAPWGEDIESEMLREME